MPRSLRIQTIRTDLPDQSLRWMAKVFDARGRAWTFQASSDLLDTAWGVVEMDLSDPLNTLVGEVKPPLSIHALWMERTGRTTGDGDPYVVNSEAVLVADIVQVTDSGGASIHASVIDELKPEEAFSIRASVEANTGRSAYYDALPDDTPEPFTAEVEASPFTRDGSASLWGMPLRTRAERDIPQLRKQSPIVYAIGDREALRIAGLGVGEDAVLGIDATQMAGKIVGVLDDIPTLTDSTRQGSSIVDFMALVAVLSGPATWSFGEIPARVTSPQELWVRTGDTDAAIRQPRWIAMRPRS